MCLLIKPGPPNIDCGGRLGQGGWSRYGCNSIRSVLLKYISAAQGIRTPCHVLHSLVTYPLDPGTSMSSGLPDVRHIGRDVELGCRVEIFFCAGNRWDNTLVLQSVGEHNNTGAASETTTFKVLYPYY